MATAVRSGPPCSRNRFRDFYCGVSGPHRKHNNKKKCFEPSNTLFLNFQSLECSGKSAGYKAHSYCTEFQRFQAARTMVLRKQYSSCQCAFVTALTILWCLNPQRQPPITRHPPGLLLSRQCTEHQQPTREQYREAPPREETATERSLNLLAFAHSHLNYANLRRRAEATREHSEPRCGLSESVRLDNFLQSSFQ